MNVKQKILTALAVVIATLGLTALVLAGNANMERKRQNRAEQAAEQAAEEAVTIDPKLSQCLRNRTARLRLDNDHPRGWPNNPHDPKAIAEIHAFCEPVVR